MNAKCRLFCVLLVLSIFFVACGAPPATMPTEAPAGDISTCSVTPDGLGQQAGGHVSSAGYLGDVHGKFVYLDLMNHIINPPGQEGAFDVVFTRGNNFQGDIGLSMSSEVPKLSDLVVILVVDVFSLSQDQSVGDVNSFIKRMDLLLDKNTGNQGLLLVAVDTNNLAFDAIFNNIPAAVNYFSANNVQFGDFPLPKASQLVVNMSFVFTPCEPMRYISSLLNDYNSKYGLNLGPDELNDLEKLGEAYNNHDGNFYKYVNCIGFNPNDCLQSPMSLRAKLKYQTDNYDKIKGELASKDVPISLTGPLSDDQINDAVFNNFIVKLVYSFPPDQLPWVKSLASLHNNLGAYSNVFFVAAAGNFGYSNPFAPGYWSFVYSVSSNPSSQPSHIDAQQVSNGLSLAKYSNWGDVQMDGDFWAVPDAIYGTSFAAPKFSASLAQHLLMNDNCPMRFNSISETGPWNNALYTCVP